jgi:hypothetical protein
LALQTKDKIGVLEYKSASWISNEKEGGSQKEEASDSLTDPGTMRL